MTVAPLIVRFEKVELSHENVTLSPNLTLVSLTETAHANCVIAPEVVFCPALGPPDVAVTDEPVDPEVLVTVSELDDTKLAALLIVVACAICGAAIANIKATAKVAMFVDFKNEFIINVFLVINLILPPTPKVTQE